MIYAIQLNEDPQGTTTRIGFQFIKAASQRGHQILQVFFYQEAVLSAFESSIEGCAWSELAAASRIDLVYCSAAAERLRPAVPPLPGFRAGGLAGWVDASLRADRVMRLGGA